MLIFLCFASSFAKADELRPTYLEFNEIETQHWQVSWKSSASSSVANLVSLQLPADCTWQSEFTERTVDSVSYRRGQFNCAEALAGKSVTLIGLEQTTTDAIIKISFLSQPQQLIRLTPRQTSATFANHNQAEGTNGIASVILTYTILGVEHIVFGFDHLLFVLGVVLLITGFTRLLTTITAFTVAHSMTLIATSLGWVGIAIKPTEAVIALSIVFLASEVLKTDSDKLRLTEKLPWLFAIGFGLLHGFGFASALSQIGLPEDDLVSALLAFNIGVELGQIGLVILFLLALRVARWLNIEQSLKVVTAYGMGIIAAFWVIERSVAIVI